MTMLSNPMAPQAGSILCLNAPQGLEFGIDYCMWAIGPKFMGIRGIPPGPHFIYWSVGRRVKDCSDGDDGDDGKGGGRLNEEDAFRTGLFVYLEPGQTIVKRWTPDTETFENMWTEDEEDRYIQGVANHNFDGNLGPYPMEWLGQWSEVSKFITQEVIERIEPLSKFIGSSMAEYREDTNGEQSNSSLETQTKVAVEKRSEREADKRSEMEADEWSEIEADERSEVEADEKSEMEADERNETRSNAEDSTTEQKLSRFQPGLLYFCDIPKPRIKHGCSPSEITRLSHDRSEILSSIIDECLDGDANQLLGEIQFAYVCFLLSQNFEAFSHWKSLIILLCHCETAVRERPQLFSDFIRVLHCHLAQAPEDFFSDNLLSENFFIQCLANLCEICSDASLPPQLLKRTDYIKSAILKKFGVSIDDLVSWAEDAPIVVNEQQSFYTFDSDVDESPECPNLQQQGCDERQ